MGIKVYLGWFRNFRMTHQIFRFWFIGSRLCRFSNCKSKTKSDVGKIQFSHLWIFWRSRFNIPDLDFQKKKWFWSVETGTIGRRRCRPAWIERCKYTIKQGDRKPFRKLYIFYRIQLAWFLGIILSHNHAKYNLEKSLTIIQSSSLKSTWTILQFGWRYHLWGKRYR